VLLSYRLPREPSTPRITIWRKLKRLGVAQIGDGVVALPADARTREHLEWIAEEITDAHGNAAIWLAQPTTQAAERELAATMAAARIAEYTHVITEATAAAHLEAPERAAAAQRLRAELRRINRRDYFPPTHRDTARRAVHNLTDPDPERLAPAEEHP
jgi:ATPase subunit of ABC transporter with duplicated ATPase domains